MNKELHRPCVISNVNVGTPFCAYTSFVGLFEHDEFWEVFIDDESSPYRHVYAIADTEKEANDILRILEWQLAQALNPPIEVTQAVLDAMDKVPEAKFLASWKDDGAWYACQQIPLAGNKLAWQTSNRIRLGVWEEDCYIQADCPLALEVLLQFTLDGKRKETE